MGRCIWCNRDGFFMLVDGNRLCADCGPGVRLEVERRLEIIRESQDLVNRSKNVWTRLSRCQLILREAEQLLIYERRGLEVFEPSPEAIIGLFTDAAGAKVRTLGVDRVVANSAKVWWDQRNDRGRRVPAGVYWIQAKSRVGRVSRRVVSLQ